MSGRYRIKSFVARSGALSVLVALAALSGAQAASLPDGAFREELSAAMQVEQTGGADPALDAYLTLLALAADATHGAPTASAPLAATLAAVEALLEGHYQALLPAAVEQGLAFRTAQSLGKVIARMEPMYERAAGPFVRSELASALTALYAYSGDAPAARKWRAATGAVHAATVVGPLSWPPLAALGQATPLSRAGTKLAVQYPGMSPFTASRAPSQVAARQDYLPIGKTNRLDGVLMVVVDAEVPRAQTIGVALSCNAAAVVAVGGKELLKRSHALGSGMVTRYGVVTVSAGRVRVAVQVAKQGVGAALRLRLTGQDGRPLLTYAPGSGDLAMATASQAAALQWPRRVAEQMPELLDLAALLATGEARTAEHLLEHAELLTAAAASPQQLLLFARALAAAGDLPAFRQHELQRTAYEKVLKRWPSSWEAVVGRAQQLGAQRDAKEGPALVLRELGLSPQNGAKSDPLVSAYVATVATDAGYLDLAQAALASIALRLGKTPFLSQLDGWIGQRVGAERVQYLCQAPLLDRHSTACLEALRSRGDFPAALAELGRLQGLREEPLPLWGLALLMASGDNVGALKVYDSMLPAERSLLALGLLPPAASPHELRTRLYRDAPDANDAAAALADLLGTDGEAALGDAAQSPRWVAEDRAQPKMPEAATAVLVHRERYALSESGVLTIGLYDLRRVTGTSDVSAGAPLSTPQVEGRAASRVIRRRVFKTDGRIIESDRSLRTSQTDTDLSGLESGDYVESVYQAWALPGAAGQLVVDTPDLLPDRTSMGVASVELRLPATLRFSLWAHPLLGQPVERTEGNTVVKTWSLREAGPRRQERQVPSMDRNVAVSFGTLTWQHLGRLLTQTAAELEDEDAVVTAWVRAAAQVGSPKAAAPTPRELVNRLLDAVGKRVPFAVSLDDSGAVARWRARSALETGTGSRSWLLYHALRTVGLQPELVLAESKAYSSSADFPAHSGRFRHPLVVAHLPGGDLWVDADVQGPPLPPGHVSVELRGRLALRMSGQMIPISASFVDAGDEVQIDLTLDDRGNATGKFAIALQGRPGQLLADSFARVVGDQRANILRKVVLGWLPFANVDAVSLVSKEGSWNIEVRAQISIPGYAQKEAEVWLLPGLEPVHASYPSILLSSLSSRFASQGGRQNALAINNAMQYRAHRRVQLPAGWQARVAADLEVKETAIQTSRRTRVAAGRIEEDFSLSLPTGTIPLQQYPGFVAALRSIDDGFLATVGARY